MNTRDPPSKILLIIITYLPPTYPLTNDSLFALFSEYGNVRKVLIFERGKVNKAFVEFYEVRCAIAARRGLNGRSISPFRDRVLVHFSRLRELDLEVVDNTRGTDYKGCDESTSQQAESPSKIMMEAQRKQLEQILDDDYASEVESFVLSQQIQEVVSQVRSRILVVRNVDEKVTVKMLYNLFNRFAQLEGVQYEKGLRQARLQFTTQEQATIAKELLNNVMFFSSQLRILYGDRINESEMYYGSGIRYKTVLPSKTLQISGVKELDEIQKMVGYVGKIQEYKRGVGDSLELKMTDVFEALKVIAVFSEYNFHGVVITLLIK